MADENILWYRQVTLKNIAKHLNDNGFSAIIAENAGDALVKTLELIKPEESVGYGGSRTLEQTGILDALRSRKQNLFSGGGEMAFEEKLKMRRTMLSADVFMASPNAVTMDGKLLFLDMIGNRTSGMSFGPKRVIAVAGFNKIVKDEAAGWDRIRNYASPVNAKRLKLNTPCATTGVCSDCDSPQRICGVAMALWKKPRHTDYNIILVPEELGY